MTWKTAHRSFYYANAEPPDDIRLDRATTALLVIDIQNTYLEDKETPAETARWRPFFERMRGTVIPNTRRLIDGCRARGVEVIFARIACQKQDGRDRSLSQKKPGFNYLLLPKDTPGGQIVPELTPEPDDIVMLKTTDSALTGTNLRLILRNMEHTRRCRRRQLHPPVRLVDRAEPGRRELRRGRGRRLLRGGDDGAARRRAADHQHDLLSCGPTRRGSELLSAVIGEGGTVSSSGCAGGRGRSGRKSSGRWRRSCSPPS